MKTIKLAHPIEIEGREPLATIILRRPRLKDVEAMNKAMRLAGGSVTGTISDTDAESIAIATGERPHGEIPAAGGGAAIAGGIALLASMNGVDPGIIREMDVEDFAGMQEDLAGFFQQVRLSNPGA